MPESLFDQMGPFIVAPATLARDGSLTVQAKAVYIALRSYVNSATETPTAYPGYAKIKEHTGLSYDTLTRAVRELERAGWLERKKRYGGSTLYVMKAKKVSAPQFPKISDSEETGVQFPKISESSFRKNRTDLEPENNNQINKNNAAAVPNLDALAKAAKIDKTPSARVAKAKAEKVKANSQYDLGELEKAPAIRVHRDVCGQQLITREQAQRIISQVNGTAETTWRDRLRFWMAKGWRADTIDRHIAFNETEDKRIQARAPKPVAGPAVSADTYSEIMARLEATI